MLQSGRPEQRLAAKMRAHTRDSIAARGMGRSLGSTPLDDDMR
jgi:hypothetical protein